jgi:hypothetical protein
MQVNNSLMAFKQFKPPSPAKTTCENPDPKQRPIPMKSILPSPQKRLMSDELLYYSSSEFEEEEYDSTKDFQFSDKEVEKKRKRSSSSKDEISSDKELRKRYHCCFQIFLACCQLFRAKSSTKNAVTKLVQIKKEPTSDTKEAKLDQMNTEC